MPINKNVFRKGLLELLKTKDEDAWDNAENLIEQLDDAELRGGMYMVMSIYNDKDYTTFEIIEEMLNEIGWKE